MKNRKINKNQLKVFIAGSKVLEVQRNILRAVLMRQQSLCSVMIEAKTFEDFSDSLIEGGAQKTLYNKYISCEADIVVFVLDGLIGGFTKEEFDVAYKSYTQSKHPKIFIYCKKEGKSISIDKFKEELNSMHQYYTEYVDDKELERLFEKSINEYIINERLKIGLRPPKEQIAFELACQELSNTLISCLNVIDQLGCIVKGLSISWDKFLIEYRGALTEERKLICKGELLRALEHYLDEEQRISKIFPPSKILISKDCIELLASQVDRVSEVTMLPSMYSTYFDNVLDSFKAIQAYLSDVSPSAQKSRSINLNLQGFFYLVNGIFYTLLVYLTQLPEEHQKNLKECQMRWQILPKNISINLPPDEYERFAEREFDEYEKNLIRLEAVVESQYEEHEISKQQIDAMVKAQLDSSIHYCSYCGYKLGGNEMYCPQCGKNLSDINTICS